VECGKALAALMTGVVTLWWAQFARDAGSFGIAAT